MEDQETTAANESTDEADAGHLRLLEAVLFAAPDPLTEAVIAERLPDGADVAGLLQALSAHYKNHGINLVQSGGRWFFRTAPDLADQLRVYRTVARRLSRAAMETLAIIAYHQPVTRAEIEEIRGVGLSRGTLDALLEAGWIGPKGKRRTAGRPTTWGTNPRFLAEFGLESIKDLPGMDDLKAAGLLDKRPSMQITDMQPTQAGDGEEEEHEDADSDAPDDQSDLFPLPIEEPEVDGNTENPA